MSKRRNFKKNMELKKIYLFIIVILFSNNLNSEIINPNEKLSVSIQQTDKEDMVLTAIQTGKRKEFNFKQLIINFFSYPLMTIKIIGAIHYEALLLWKKGAIYRKRSKKFRNNLSYEKY